MAAGLMVPFRSLQLLRRLQCAAVVLLAVLWRSLMQRLRRFMWGGGLGECCKRSPVCPLSPAILGTLLAPGLRFFRVPQNPRVIRAQDLACLLASSRVLSVSNCSMRRRG